MSRISYFSFFIFNFFWTAYDAKHYKTKLPAKAPKMHQERAYTSPIWYSPGK